jgi:hypothetical protein
MGMSQEECKRILCATAANMAKFDDLSKPECVGRVSIGGLRAKVRLAEREAQGG